jgi:2,4-dienoyl-CoA reductase-like NADH-dependent reductase (Old Yellow Enzyme family)/thioredoxin reductase
MESQTAYPTLFSPISVGGVPMRNRIAHASIVTRFVREGQASDRLITYLGSRAQGGTALIITEPVAMAWVNREPTRLRAWDDGAMDSLKRLVEAVERHDSRIIGQLQDPGRGRHAIGRNDGAVGASALPDDISWTVPHPLETTEVRRLIAEWAEGCRRLQRAGFSGIEISAGHGHLFHQFLSPQSNHRTDDFGGDLAGRTRLLREVVTAIRAACGRPFMIGLKLPGDDGVPGGIDLAEARRIAESVATTREVDYWTFVWGAHANSLWTHLPGPAGPRAPYVQHIRELRKADPSVVTGAISYITDPNEAERSLLDDSADIVFLGRPLITDPAFGEKARTGREAEIRYCVSCNTCWKTVVEGTGLECDNNPRVAEPEEVDWRPAPAPVRRRVVVVGSGIAGMEAAWVAAARKHDVVVLAASDEVGGKTRIFAELPGGEHLSSIYDYQRLAAGRHGVRFRHGVLADETAVRALEPDVVVLATGAEMAVPAFVPAEFVEEGFVTNVRALAVQMRGRKTREEGRLVLFDQDHTEMTYAAAERFSQVFEKVTIVTPRERIASDCPLVNRQAIYQRLRDRRIEIVTGVMPRDVDGLDEGRLTVYDVWNGDPTAIEGVAAITYSTPRIPNDSLTQPLKAAGIQVIAVGDCFAPRSVLAATRHGYQVGVEV